MIVFLCKVLEKTMNFFQETFQWKGAERLCESEVDQDCSKIVFSGYNTTDALMNLQYLEISDQNQHKIQSSQNYRIDQLMVHEFSPLLVFEGC